MVLWCNGLAHVPSKHIVGVRIPLGLQMESKPVRVLGPPAKRVVRVKTDTFRVRCSPQKLIINKSIRVKSGYLLV